jgi:hypothetical protein
LITAAREDRLRSSACATALRLERCCEHRSAAATAAGAGTVSHNTTWPAPGLLNPALLKARAARIGRIDIHCIGRLYVL